MIRFPDPQLTAAQAFQGSTLADWLPASHVQHALELAAAAHGPRTAIRFLTSGEAESPRRDTSYDDLLADVNRAANVFRRLGVGRRDVVAYLLPSLPATQFVLWGAETAGIAFPINPLLQTAEIAALARAAGVKVLVTVGPATGTDLWERAVAVRDAVPTITALVQVGGASAEGAVDFSAAMADAPPQLAFDDRPAAGDVAAIFHTGGTTGLPKLALHTHRNQLAAAYGGAHAAGLCANDVMLNGLPMFHVAATIFSSLAMLLAGARVVLLSPQGFRNTGVIAHFWRIVQRERATIVGGVPTALAAVLSQSAADADLSSIRINVSGAALTPRGIAQQLEAVTGRPLREIYGMTECGGVISVDPVSVPRVLGSAGLPIAFCEVEARVLTTAGPAAACPPGEPGVLVVRGPNVSPGYLDAHHNAGLFTHDGWLITGDLGLVDTTGRVFVTGRAKDLIIRSGHNIDPAAVEDGLARHPAISEVAVVGMPDAYAGEVPVAYAVLRPGHAVEEIDLKAFAADNLHEPPAVPRRVFLVDRLPLTAVGKVFKPQLRLDAARRHFAELLREEPVARLDVRDHPVRGRMACLTLEPCPDEAGARARIGYALQPYAVALVWEDDETVPA